MDSEVQQVKDRLNIQEVISQYVQLRRAGRSFVGKCPFHKEKTPSFHVSPERGTYKCFGCGEGGDIFSFVEKIEGVDFGTALRQLAARAGVKLSRVPAPQGESKDKLERLHEVVEAATRFFEVELTKRKDIQDYLKTRGVLEKTITEWRLGYAPATWEGLCEHLRTLGFSNDEMVESGFAIASEKKKGEVYDRFRGRIMFPINDMGGRVIASSGRFFEKVEGGKVEGEPAKYVNSPETALFKKSKTLYGFDKAKGFIRKADCILLVEGQFDLVLSHQSGLPFAVALSGTALTPEHLSFLSRLSKRLVLALDADTAGIKAGLRSAYMAITAGFDVKVPTFPQGKDPADLVKENPELLKAAVRTSQTAIEFFLNALWPTARDERSYKKLVEAQVLPLIAAIGSSIDQEHFVKIVAERLSVSEAAVRQEVNKVKGAPGVLADELPPTSKDAATQLSPLERAAGMLIFHFEKNEEVQERLAELIGKERLGKLKEALAPRAEELRFKVEHEVGEHSEEATVAEDMFKQLEILSIDEEILAAKGDARKLTALARRKHELQK